MCITMRMLNFEEKHLNLIKTGAAYHHIQVSDNKSTFVVFGGVVNLQIHLRGPEISCPGT